MTRQALTSWAAMDSTRSPQQAFAVFDDLSDAAALHRLSCRETHMDLVTIFWTIGVRIDGITVDVKPQQIVEKRTLEAMGRLELLTCVCSELQAVDGGVHGQLSSPFPLKSATCVANQCNGDLAHDCCQKELFDKLNNQARKPRLRGPFTLLSILGPDVHPHWGSPFNGSFMMSVGMPGPYGPCSALSQRENSSMLPSNLNGSVKNSSDPRTFW